MSVAIHRLDPATLGSSAAHLVAGRKAELWIRGAFPEQGRRLVVVGSRSARRAELAKLGTIIKGLADQDLALLTGGALGVEAAASELALDAGIPVVAVLGSGLQYPYPERNRPLFDRVVEAGGCLLSPTPPDASLRNFSLAQRNRLLVELANTVLFAELGLKKSAGLSIYRLARERGRACVAMPGSPGTEMLLRSGVPAVSCASALLSPTETSDKTDELKAKLDKISPIERQVLFALDSSSPKTEASIRQDTGITARNLRRALISLELQGLVRAASQQSYLRNSLAQENKSGN